MANRLIKDFFSSETLYKKLFTPILSRDEGLDAEELTQLALTSLEQASLYRNIPGLSGLLALLAKDLIRQDQRLEQQLFGCSFSNPIGLAAGFDKNGVAAGIWNYFGFGFAELGTVTWHAQKGNPKPRLFRLAKEQAALNRMGFNNDGAATMLKTLKRQKIKPPGQRSTVLGINLGKSKITTLNEAARDYASSLELLGPFSDYVVINVSSPNTPELRKLQDPTRLRHLIKCLKRLPECPPLLVKIAPDLENNAIDELAILAKAEGLAGVIAVNTSIDRLGLNNRVISQTGLTLEQETGGLSGSPLRKRAIEVLRRLRVSGGENLTLIGVGGIDSPETAWERITAGASLLQVYTGWIFRGPHLIPQIIEGLSNQLDRHGFQNISDAIGSEAPWK